MDRRTEILEELVRFEKPSEPLVRELQSFGWDWEDAPLVVITRDDVLRVIDRFLVGNITAAQLEEWAEILEMRDDVAFDNREEELLDDVFCRIATPSLYKRLTIASVRNMRNELTSNKGQAIR